MIKYLQRRYTVPHPRLLWTPASCGGGCRWKGRIQHTQRKGGFAGTRHPGNTHDFPQRNIDVYIF